jgi:hypothetical protein
MVQQFQEKVNSFPKGDGMIRSRRFNIALAFLTGTLFLATNGCSLFGQKPPPQRPRTVEEWMAQPRVQPQ